MVMSLRWPMSFLASWIVPLALSACAAEALPAPPMVWTPPALTTPPIRVRARQTSDVFDLLRQVQALSDAGRIQDANAVLNQAHDLNARRIDAARAEPLLLRMKGTLLLNAGAFDLAETTLKQSMLRDGSDPSTYMKLGDLYLRQARWSEAEGMFRRAIDLDEKRDGKQAPTTGEALNSLGILYAKTGQDGRAVPIFERVIAIFRAASGRNEDEIAAALANLGSAYQNMGQADKALASFAEAFRLDLARFGPNYPNTVLVESNTAVLLGQLGRFDDAAPMLEHVLAFTRKRFGDDNVQTAHVMNNLGWIEIGRLAFPRALDLLRPALSIYLRQRALQASDTTARGIAVDEREVSRTILGLMHALALAPAATGDADALLDEAFQAAQVVHRTKAAQALALTTARFATGDGALARLIRERQDLADQWQTMDRDLTGAMTLPATARHLDQEAAARAKQDFIHARIAEVDRTISGDFPDYAALADPNPLSLQAVRDKLRPDEALLLVASFGGSNGEGSFTFAITREAARWHASDVGTTELTKQVQTLLCGLDIDQWDKPEDRDRCQRLVGRSLDPAHPPFDAATAARLHATIIGDVGPMIVGKTLLVVAPDPLASLPLEVLVTSPPDEPQPADLRGVAWLGRAHAIAVLPSTTSLLTRGAPGAAAPEAFIGFGNPSLDGGLNCPDSEVAETCPTRDSAAVAVMTPIGDASIESVVRGGSARADVDAVRALCPLPETGLELRCVAKSLNAPADVVHEGSQATLAALRATQLDRYRILHFATHGLVAGEMQTDKGTTAEPALVMTPPQTAQPDDDGLLRASEIAGLKLNADWVLLSACNTAAGSSLGGEAMSGLARAFFYAGARALLVSHWPVRSDVAVLLTTDALRRLADDRALGRAEALHRAEVSLMNTASGAYAHPSLWAPFSLVGDAGPMRPAP